MIPCERYGISIDIVCKRTYKSLHPSHHTRSERVYPSATFAYARAETERWHSRPNVFLNYLLDARFPTDNNVQQLNICLFVTPQNT